MQELRPRHSVHINIRSLGSYPPDLDCYSAIQLNNDQNDSE